MNVCMFVCVCVCVCACVCVCNKPEVTGATCVRIVAEAGV